MSRSGGALLLVLASASAAVAGPPQASSPAPSDPLGAPPVEASWSVSLDAYLYPHEDDDSLMPMLEADRGRLHLESRYQYEDFETLSAWVGWSFEAGEALHLEVVPGGRTALRPGSS